MSRDDQSTRVLVVDDEPDIRALLRIVLAAEGWDVVEAGSGPEALELARDRRIDIVILDHRMPEMTGIDVARGLLGEHVGAPMIVFSAYFDRELQEECTGLGLVTVNKLDLPGLIEHCRRLEPGPRPAAVG